MPEPYDYRLTELSPDEQRQRLRRWARGWAWIIGTVIVLVACVLLATAWIELPPDPLSSLVTQTPIQP